MAEAECNGMEMQARTTDISIDGITDDRMTNPRQVRPQLMGAPRHRHKPKAGDAGMQSLRSPTGVR